MAESQSIADLFVALGVKADPGSFETLNTFDKLLAKVAKSVQAFDSVAATGAASISALGASGTTLSPLISQLDALLSRLSEAKAAGAIKTTTVGGGPSTKLSSTAKADEAALKAAAKAADQEAAAVEKARAKLETIGASASAVDKATLAFKREQEAILQAAAATGDDAAALKALDAAEQKHAANLAKISKAEEKAAEQAAKLTEAQQQVAEGGGSSLFSADNLASFADGFGVLTAAIEKAAAVTATAVAGVTALGAALAANSLAVAKDALAIKRTSEATGLSAEEYQRVAYALERYGVQAEKIPEVLGKMATQATAAKGGSKDAAAAFKQLGISSAAYLKLKPEDQLKALADGFQKIKDPSKRAALATKLLGDEMARSLLPLLMQGSDGLEALGDQAEDLGLVFSDETIEESESLTQVWAELTGIAEGLQQQLGAKLIPILAELGQKLLNWLTANKDLIDQKFDVVVENLVVAFDQLSVAATALDDVFGGLDGFFDFVETVATVTAGVWSFAAALGLISTGLPALAAGFTAVSLAVQDVYTYFTGGTSVIGTLIEQFGQTDTLLGALIRSFQAAGAVASAAFNLVAIAFSAAWDAAAPFRDLLAAIADIAGGVLLAGIQSLTTELTSLLNVLTAALNATASLLGTQGAATGAQAIGGAIGSGGVTGAVLAPAAASLASTLAPTTAPQAASKGATTVQITVGGAQISGLGMSPEQVQSALNQHTDYQNRQIQQALIGANL